MDSFYQSFSPLFTNHLEVHSRWYMFLWKRWSCEYQHSRCLARIIIALNHRSVFGQIQYTNPPEHLCLLKKLLQLVPVLVLTWSSYMIGDCNFDLSFPWCLHRVCLSLIHAGIHANKLLIKAHPIRNLPMPASTAMNKMGFLEQASLTLSPQPPSFFPSSLFPTPFDACYAGSVLKRRQEEVWKLYF